MCLRIWRNTLSVQIKDIICMMQADHPFKVNGWSVSFLELAFYFGCPGVNAFGGFVTFVHFVEGKSYECTVYHGDGRGEGIPVRADFVAQEGTSAILQVLVEYSDAVAECVAVGFGVTATEWKGRRSSVLLHRHTSRPAVRRLPKWRYLEPALHIP